MSDFISGDSKITADGDCSHEIKRHLLLGRKVMTNLYRVVWYVDLQDANAGVGIKDKDGCPLGVLFLTIGNPMIQLKGK